MRKDIIGIQQREEIEEQLEGAEPECEVCFLTNGEVCDHEVLVLRPVENCFTPRIFYQHLKFSQNSVTAKN